MKHSSIVSLGLGLLAGFFIGSAFHGRHESDPTQPDTPSQNALTQNNAKHEQELLEETTKQPDQAHAELTKAKAYIEQLEPKAARYEKTRDLWKEYGFGYNPLAFKDAGMIPSESLIKFFGWDDKTVAEINRIGEDTERKILDWETEQAICVENTTDRRVFEIPAAPTAIRDGYKASLESIIGKEDTELVILEATRKLDQYLRRRVVAFSPCSDENTSAQDSSPKSIRFEVKGYNDSPDYSGSMDGEFGVSFSRSGTMPYAPGTYFYDRWHHLLGENPF